MGILRLLLAVVVVFAHIGYLPGRMIGSDLAVETFFMISGFYMAMVLNEKYLPGGRVTPGAYKLFLRARLMRLFPLYLAVLVLTFVVQAFVLRPGHIPVVFEQPAVAQWTQMSGHIAAPDKAALGLSNLVMFGQDIMMYLGLDPATKHLHFTSNFANEPVPAWTFMLIPQAWSLSIELWFYLLAPFLVTRSVRWMACVAVASLALRFFLLRNAGLYFDPWTYRFFPSELWIFLGGAMSYRLYRWMRAREAVPGLGYAALAVAVVSILVAGHAQSQPKVVLHLCLMAVCIPVVFRWTKNNRLDRYVGELSYPLYMVHMLILQTLLAAGIMRNGVLVGACVAGAVGVLYAVDLPVERFRQRWVNRHRPAEAPTPAASLAT